MFACSRSPVQFLAGPGDFVGPILFCIRMAYYSSGKVGGLVLKHFLFTNTASQWLYVNLVWRFYTLLGRVFSGHFGFLLHLKIGILLYFWSHIVCTSLLGCPRLPVCALWLSHISALRTQWVVSCVLQKPQIIIIYYFALFARCCWYSVTQWKKWPDSGGGGGGGGTRMSRGVSGSSKNSRN